jgi:hypothetical protein
MSHRQIRTPVAIKPLNLLSLAARIDVVAAPSLATRSPLNWAAVHRCKIRRKHVMLSILWEACIAGEAPVGIAIRACADSNAPGKAACR